MRKFVILLMVFPVILFTSCLNSGNTGTRVTSVAFKEPQQRVEALKKYFNLKIEVHDADFDIFDVNLDADRSIPGATSRDYKVVLFMEPQHAAAWVDQEKITSFPIDFSWAYQVSPRLPAGLFAKGGMFIRDGAKDTLVLKDEGIVIIRILQL